MAALTPLIICQQGSPGLRTRCLVTRMGAVLGGPACWTLAPRAKISIGVQPSRRMRTPGSSAMAVC
eukprot:8384945-Heterocapsa_arctica.AAC.1